jgi:hypothetical protein
MNLTVAGISRWFLISALGFALCGCGGQAEKKADSLKSFTQIGPRSLSEFIDKQGQLWQVASVEEENLIGEFILNSAGQVDLIAIAYTDKIGLKNAVILLDSSEKEAALAVLDKRFLSGVSPRSNEYENWLKKTASFSYGGAQTTRMIDIEQGKLGKGTVHLDGGKFAMKIDHANCACVTVACGLLPLPNQECAKKLCDVINCVIDFLNGDRQIGCGVENAVAQQTCAQVGGILF